MHQTVWRSVFILSGLAMMACSPLELPHQVSAVGLDLTTTLNPPCPGWCRVEGEVRALTDDVGRPIAFEVSLVAQPWDRVLEMGRAKWGKPSVIYQVEASADPNESTRWMAAARDAHRRHVGASAEILRVGDPRETTDYAVWKGKGTMVRMERDTNGVRATWIQQDPS